MQSALQDRVLQGRGFGQLEGSGREGARVGSPKGRALRKDAFDTILESNEVARYFVSYLC